MSIEETTLTTPVSAIGALDRYNVGDLLFADIATRYIPEIEFYSPFGANLSSFRSVASRPLSELPESSNLLFIGGEIFSATWIRTLRQLKPPRLDGLIPAVPQKIDRMVIDLMYRNLTLKKWDHPFIPTGKNLERKVAYASVGGAADFRSLFLLPPKSTYISVRDSTTRDSLIGGPHRIKMAPDPVSIIALDSKVVNSKEGECDLLIQSSYNWYRKSQNRQLLHQLVSDAVSRSMKVSYCVFGYTIDHADQMTFLKLSQSFPSLKLIDAANPYEILKSISDANYFVGTSLHGHIISTALGVPNCPLPGIPKLENYMQTWIPEFYKERLDFPNFAHMVELLDKFASYFGERGKELGTFAEKNYEQIADFLKS